MALLLLINIVGESVIIAVLVASAAVAAHILTIQYRDALWQFHCAIHSAYISFDDADNHHHHPWESGSDTDPATDDDHDGEQEDTRCIN